MIKKITRRSARDEEETRSTQEALCCVLRVSSPIFAPSDFFSTSIQNVMFIVIYTVAFSALG